MRHLFPWLVVLLAASPAPAAAPPPDADPLPPGARLRLGLPRFRLPIDRQADGTPVVLSADRKLVARDDEVGAVRVYDTRSGRQSAVLRMKKTSLVPLAFAPDGKRLAVASEDGFLYLWPFSDGGPARRFGRRLFKPETVDQARAAFLPGCTQLATWDGSRLAIWDLASGKRLWQASKASDEEASFSPDGSRFVCQSAGGLHVADLAARRWLTIRLPGAKEAPLAAWSWSADGRLLAVSTDETVQLYDAVTGRPGRVLARDNAPVPPTAFSPSGRTLAAEAEDGLRIYDVASGKVLRDLRVSGLIDPGVEHLHYRDEHHLLVFDFFGFVRTWDVRTGEEVRASVGHCADISGLAFTADGSGLVSVGKDGGIRRWDVRSGRRLGLVDPGDMEWGSILSLSANGRLAALADESGLSVALVEVVTGRVVWHVEALDMPALVDVSGRTDAPLRDLCVIAPDGSLVAVPRSAEDGSRHRVELWRGSDGRLVRSIESRTNARLAFAPNGQALALSPGVGGGAEVQMIDVQTGKLRQTLKGPGGSRWLAVVAVSADGRLVAGADDQHAYLWEVASALLLDRAPLPKGFDVSQVVVTRAGRTLLLGSTPTGDSARCVPSVWDLAARERVWAADGVRRRTRAELCGTGRTVALGRDDGSILLYDVPQQAVPRPTVPDKEELNRLWDDLASADGPRAWRARHRLAAAPAEVVALLADRLRPAPAGPVNKDVADLDADDFTVRDAAAKRLAEGMKKGDRAVEAALRDVLRRKPSLGAYRQAERLLALAGPLAYSREELRAIRAVAVLEQVGGDGAVRLLKKLAAGGASTLAGEASSALTRMR